MDVLSRSEQQKIISSSFIVALFGGLALFVVILLTSAAQLSNETGEVVGSIGPIKLFELHKNPLASGGYSAGLSFAPSIIGYILVCVLIGVCIAIFRSRRTKK